MRDSVNRLRTSVVHFDQTVLVKINLLYLFERIAEKAVIDQVKVLPLGGEDAMQTF